jgi:PAS domain S-box-containing protein
MYRLRRADGGQFWAEITGRRMSGKPKRSVWVITDITLLVANQQRNRAREPA